MRNICLYITLLASLFWHQAMAQEPLDSAFLEHLDSLIQIVEREQAIRKTIDEFEQVKMKRELQFDFSNLMPVARGLILSYTEDDFMKHPGTLMEKSSSYSTSDYAVASAPLVAAWAMKAAGVKSRSKMKRMVTANAMALAMSCGTTEVLKQTIDEKRPDGSDDKSMPSGHSAIAFTSAAILAREYGYLSPWITIGGYATATGTELLRIQHNKHWMNDLYVGAGIGMLSTNLAYFLTDRIFKEEGILTPPEVRMRDIKRLLKYNSQPSGLSFVTGTEFGSRTFNIDGVPVKAYASFSSGVDVSWFLSESFAVEAMGRFTNGYAKLYNERVNGLSHYIFNGENMEIFHVGVGAKVSQPIALDKRVSARAFGGFRHLNALEFASDDAVSIALPSEYKFELGCGVAYDAIDKDNYSVGFSFDYYHAFSNVMSNRYNISSVWKILF